MAVKQRVWELARELGVGNRELMSALSAMGVPVRSPGTPLDASVQEQVRERLKSQTSGDVAEARVVALPEQVTVGELAELLGVQSAQVQRQFIGLGHFLGLNDSVGFDLAAEVAAKFNVTVTPEEDARAKARSQRILTDDPDARPRPPIVTILGHVDHGKTTLLDAIRHSRVVESESGGITQHIGAYQVEINGRKITFLDTPGHEAFTAMRARGASVTDIAILVVAADDGVMPQTLEAIDHARAAGVPIIVAINKVDKPEANVERLKSQLADHGLLAEEYGGETIMVEISAKKRENLDALLEMILLVADMEDLKATPKGLARGVVIEAKMDRGRGPVATVLVQSGHLSVGSCVVVGRAFGRIKAMNDDLGRAVRRASPAEPVEIVGLDIVPDAGDLLEAVSSEKDARNIALIRRQAERAEKLKAGAQISLQSLSKSISEGNLKELNLILKCDVHGSLEAVRQQLLQLSTDEVVVRILHEGVGTIGESDVLLADASNAIIIGFHVKVDPKAARIAHEEGVEIRNYQVIYKLTEDIQSAMLGMLDPVYEEEALGDVEVRKVFRLPDKTQVAGCYILSGKAQRNCRLRVKRGGGVVYEGTLSSLKHLKDDVKELNAGYECGIQVDGFNAWQEGDLIELYALKQVERTL